MSALQPLTQTQLYGCRSFSTRSPCSGRRASLRSIRVAAETEKLSSPAPEGSQFDSWFAGKAGKATGAITFNKDKETFTDVFAPAGELPERLNGRLAQWAFAALVLTEWQSGGKTTVLQQAAAHPFAAASFSLTILLASLAPKFAAGVSLKDLHNSCDRENLPKILAFFNKTHELWLGRIAMVGITGLAIFETIKGGPLIG